MFTKNERENILNAVERAIRGTLAATLGRDTEVVLNPMPDRGFDGTLALAIEAQPVRFEVVVRQHATAATVAALRQQHGEQSVILFVPRLTPIVMEACRALAINCADADGNIFVRTPSSAVDIVGRPIEASRVLTDDGGGVTRLTSRSGLQIIFLLLAEPEFGDAPYRVIADAAGVSLGTVAGVVRGLDRDGYLTQTAHARSLRKTTDLLNLWTEGYRGRLFDKLRLGAFTTDTADWWRTSRDVVRQAGGQWGSETALWAVGRNLRPARGIVYVDEVAPSLISTLRLRRDPHALQAPTELRRRFWRVPAWAERDVVPSPLVYADLLADGDPRLIEAAAALRSEDPDLRRLDEH